MNNEVKLPVVGRGRKEIQLHDNGLKAGNLIESSLARLNSDQVGNLMAKAGEEALRLEVKNREQNMDYIIGKKSTEDHIDTFNMLEKRGLYVRQVVKSDIKTGAGNMRIESKSGATCFVASVAYDDPNHPDVMYLRWLRDNFLIESKSGRVFIAWYWKYGPKLAKIVKRFCWLRNLSRWIIARIVELLKWRYPVFKSV